MENKKCGMQIDPRSQAFQGASNEWDRPLNMT